MAGLNTLRNRGGIILVVVIGIALLSFLLGDFVNSGSNLVQSSKMNAGVIDGTKVPYMDYANKVDYYTELVKIGSGIENLEEEEVESVRKQAWDQLIMEHLYTPSYKDLGLSVGETEQFDMVQGEFIAPIIRQMFSDRSTGQFDKSSVVNFVKNMDQDPSGRSRYMWNYIETTIKDQRIADKYLALVSKGFYVTDLEVQRAINDAKVNSSIQYVFQPYTSVADSSVTVTDSQIKAYYDTHKRMFKQTASRDVEYVVFDVLPSEEDYKKAEKEINKLAEEFAQTENIEQFVVSNSHKGFDASYYKKEELPAELVEFAFSAQPNSMYGPALNSDTYTLARVTGIKNLPDSIGARHILLPAEKASIADSLIGVLKKGGDFAALANEFSLDQNANKQGGDLGKFTYRAMVPAFSEAVFNANKGDIITVNTDFGTHIVEITYKGTSYPKVQLGVVALDVEPSNMTQQAVFSEANKLVTAAEKDYDKFNKAVADQDLAMRIARVKPADKTIQGVEKSRNVVFWAFGAKKHEVSEVIQIENNYVVAAVKDIKEEGVAPYEQVKNEIAGRVRQENKAKLMAENLAKEASLASAATSLNTEVQSAGDINFSVFYIPELGVEPELIGAVSITPENKLSKPVKGYNGIYLFEVTSRQENEPASPLTEKSRLQAGYQMYLGERVFQTVNELGNVSDQRYKFY